jgi:hypothetical protein
MFVTQVEKLNDKLQLQFNRGPKYSIDNYEGPLFKCGRLCIVSINSKNEIKSLYLIDSNNKPFQIHGKVDVLLEGCVVYNSTKEFIKENAYSSQICINAFNCLFKEEIQLNKEPLINLENEIFNHAFNENPGWKTLKKNIIELINNYDLEIELKEKMIEAINIAPMPKAALTKKFFIDLEEYDDSILVNY